MLVCVSLGTFQFGFMVGSWNVATGAYLKKNDSHIGELTAEVTIVQALITVGAATGALASGYVAQFGRRKSMLAANFILVACIAQGFVFDNYWSFCMTRILYGLSVGMF